VEYVGRHEHLIDSATFAKAKAVLAAHNSSAEKDRKHHHYLKGSLYCGRCGARMSLTWAKGNGGRYPYFFCLGRSRGTGCKQPYVAVDLIETAVERVYGDVRLPARQVERVRAKLGTAMAGMRTEAEAEVARQRRRLAMLSEEREKLLHAYYAEAVPLDLLHSEQERLSAETAQAEHQIEIAEASFGDVEETLGKALDLLADCERAYRKAPGHLRRQWNQALFERLVIYDEGISGAEVAEPFATLADPRLPDQLSGKAGVGSGVSSGPGSSKGALVARPGLEPGHHDFQSCRVVCGFVRFAGLSCRFGLSHRVHVFSDFGPLFRAIRPTAGAVGLFVAAEFGQTQCRRSVVFRSPGGSSHERSIARDRREVLPNGVGASALRKEQPSETLSS
jgi:hypothetical protein